jgi:hypothetical protein
MYLVNVDQLGVEELSVAGEDGLREVDEAFERREVAAVREEVADVRSFLVVVPEVHVEDINDDRVTMLANRILQREQLGPSENKKIHYYASKY